MSISETTTELTEEQQIEEWLKCSASLPYFIHNYVFIEDAIAGEWIPFRLWKAQFKALRVILNNLLVVILKARQIGMTWLVLGFALWLMLFRPAATVLIFSKRDDEAIDLLYHRLRGMYSRLPEWLQAEAIDRDSKHELKLSNGSRALAFPTTAGDSYTATLVIADEFDLVSDQDRLMRAVKPTIDNGGRMILLSRADKSRPQTMFKRLYRAAKDSLNEWACVFLAWFAHPGRDDAWYASQKEDIFSRTGSLDDLHEQYPATDTEALAPRTLDKRFSPAWVNQCFEEMDPIGALPSEAPAIPGLKVYRLPEEGVNYVIGVDPAEGNPTSDDSALSVLNKVTGEEVASLAGKFQPEVIAAHAHSIGTWFNRSGLMVERNNHGHAVILWLKDNSDLHRFDGHDNKEGWLSSTKGKTLLYDGAAESLREGETTIHTFRTMTQLQSIEGSTLRAPEGEYDDLSDSYALALEAMKLEAPEVRFRWL